MSFREKIEAIVILKLLPAKVIGMLNKINGLRINAAHPETYRIKLDKYKDRSKYLSVLKLLFETLDEVTKVSRKARLKHGTIINPK